MRKTELGLVMVAFLAIVICARQWWQNRVDRLALTEHIAEQLKTIDAATATEKQDAKVLKQRISEIEALKRKIKTPADVAKALPVVLSSLPLPISIDLPTGLSKQDSTVRIGVGAAESKPATQPAAGEIRAGAAVPDSVSARNERQRPDQAADAHRADAIVRIPAQDLKPIYDAIQTCKECELQRDSLKTQLATTKLKLQATEHERNVALVVAKGGPRWSRFRRAIKWLAIGAAVGFLAAHRPI